MSQFIKIYEIKENYWIGVMNGEWRVENNNLILRLDKINPASLLPILGNKRGFAEAIKKSTSENKALENLNIDDLIEDIIITSFEIKSNYWSQYALEWLKETNFSEKLKGYLNAVRDASWLDQKNRHLAKRLFYRN